MNSATMRRENRIKTATEAQYKASDPSQSVWLSANAGTGKTHVLIQRIIRLLLHDNDLTPRQILALTFSKEAAREIGSRLSKTLLSWPKNAPELAGALVPILGRNPTEKEVMRAKNLPVEIRLNPLATLTIHGFCQQVLHRFPKEAGITPGAIIWDDATQKECLQDAIRETFITLSTSKHSENWAFLHMAEKMAEGRLEALGAVYVHNRRKLADFWQKTAQNGGFLASLTAELALEKVSSTQEVMAILTAPTPVDTDFLNFMCSHEADVAKISKDFEKIGGICRTLRDWKGLEGTERDYEGLFLTEKGTAKAPRKKKGTETEYADIIAVYEAAQAKMLAYHVQKNKARTLLDTMAFMIFGQHVEKTYARLKKTYNALDFDDLIYLCADLLTKKETKDWVRYRLDGGVRHILLDETQDTDRDQWAIVNALCQDFFNADDAQNPAPRTLFAVGDFKQSIYRFRGAESYVFSAIKRPLITAKALGFKVWEDGILETSFRSVPAILEGVDHVFSRPEYAAKTALPNQPIHHVATRVHEGGRITLWPVCSVPKAPPAPAWTLPEEKEVAPKATRVLAGRIAREIKALLNGKNPLIVRNETGAPVGRRAATLADIMILLRSNTTLGDVLAALSQEGIPFTVKHNALSALAHPVVADVLAVLNFSVMPTDDVALAQVLRCPLFGWSNAQLDALWQRRTEAVNNDNSPCLWDVLSCGKERDLLAKIEAMARVLSPYAFLIWLERTVHLTTFMALNVAGPEQHARTEASAYVQAILRQADGFSGGLSAFVYALAKEGLNGVHSGKNGADNNQGVRILTAHGAKGLEAPIVFLADAGRNFFKAQNQDSLVWKQGADGKHEGCLFRGSERYRTQRQKEWEDIERHATTQDELRLLYVAMTRAKEQLYICAASSLTAEKLCADHKITGLPENWWGMVKTAATEENGWILEGEDWVYTTPFDAGLEAQKGAAFESNVKVLGENEVVEIPTYLQVVAEDFEKVLVPDNTATKKGDCALLGAESALEKVREEGKARGILIHTALEILPRFPPCEWAVVAENLLPHMEAEQAGVLAVLEEFSQFFGADSLAEVSIFYDRGRSVGAEKTEGVQRYIIDRLVVTDDTVTVVDFKTEGTVHMHLPEAYKAQVQQYMAAVSVMYPDKKVRGGVLWVCAGKDKRRTRWVTVE